MTNLLLACAHHILAFGLLGVITAELALCRYPLSQPRLRNLSLLDAAYGILAVLVVVVGVCRLLYGAKGPAFYTGNPVFWMKMASFAAMGIVSIWPTITFIGWKRQAREESNFMPSRDAMGRVRMLITLELALFAPIPLLAAAMARGYGL